jgi:hypothetical protein
MATSFPCFELVMSAYLVTIISTAECERVFSKLKLIKTALRNRLSQSTLEQLLHVALNGPKTIAEFRTSGLLKEALTYFFTLKNRNAKPPAEYINRELMRKLDRLKWTTSCRWPDFEAGGGSQPLTEKSAAEFASLNEDLALSWPHAEDAIEMPAEGLNDSVDAEEIESPLHPLSQIVGAEEADHEDEGMNMAEGDCEGPAEIHDDKPPERKRRRRADDLSDGLSHLFADPTANVPSDPSELRAERSRVGRRSAPRNFLSYNHHDPQSVAMLTCFT